MIEKVDDIKSVAGFIEPPRLEWHLQRPFAIARISPDYAHTMERLALREEERIMKLPVSAGWEKLAEENPVGSRYRSHHALTADVSTLSLFLALRGTYRFLLAAIGAENRPRTLQAWFNVHRSGQHLARHAHVAQFIGYFSAHAEGSTTRFGHWAEADPRDHLIENRDGQIVVTTGMHHHHETSSWQDESRPRVSFGFNISDQGERTGLDARGEPVAFIPFDGPDFSWGGENS